MFQPDHRTQPFQFPLRSNVDILAKVASAYLENDSATLTWHNPRVPLCGADDAHRRLREAMAQRVDGDVATVLRVDTAVLTHADWSAEEVSTAMDALAPEAPPSGT